MTDTPLAGSKIVVTRPREQSAKLMQEIARLGGDPVFFPLLEILPPDDLSALTLQLKRLNQFHLAIFISPNAVKHGMAAIRLAGGLPAGLRVAAVGQGSARALHSLGIDRVIVPLENSDSESLLSLQRFQDVLGQKILILRGDGGRELLGDTLRKRGATVEYAECYRRVKPDVDLSPLLAAEPDAIIVTSSEAIAHLWQMAESGQQSALLRTTLFVLHPRIADKARQLGFHDVHVTATGDDGLIAGLVAWANLRRPR